MTPKRLTCTETLQVTHTTYHLIRVSKQQRQVGKVAHLGLGFGAGHVTFQKVAKLMGVSILQKMKAET